MSAERREIRLVENEDGWWTAVDEETGVASQGETKETALANLEEAVAATEQAEAAETPVPEPDVPWFDN